MNFLFVIRRLPQPIKTLYALLILAVLGSFVATGLGVGNVAVLPVGVLGFLFGLCLSTNFRASADGLANALKSFKPMGIDYSKSFIATTAYARLFGTGAVVVGILLVGVSL